MAGADPTRVVMCVGVPIATEKTKAADLCARTHAAVQTLVNARISSET